MQRQPELKQRRLGGYNPATETLEVEFHNGSVYHYFEVPQVIFDGLMSARPMAYS